MTDTQPGYTPLPPPDPGPARPPEPTSPPTAAHGIGAGFPDGAGVLGRALVDRDGDLWHAESGGWWANAGYGGEGREGVEAAFGPVREVLLVDPVAGRVIEAAQRLVRAWDANPFSPQTAAAKAALAAAVDTLTGASPSPAPCPTCSGPIRETVGMVCQTCGKDYGTPEPATWRDIHEAMSAGEPVLAASRHAEVVIQEPEPAPEPDGDGPGWDRETVEELIAASCADATEGELNQLRFLLADRDRLAGDLKLSDLGRRARTVERDRLLRERDAARAELADLRNWLDSAKTQRDSASHALAEATAERDRFRQHSVELNIPLRHAAADALDWAAGQAAAGQLGAWDDVVPTVSLRRLAAEIRSGERTVPAAEPRETDVRCPKPGDVTTYGDQRRRYQCLCRPADGDHGEWTEPRETPADGEG